jgi:hypothetical protein
VKLHQSAKLQNSFGFYVSSRRFSPETTEMPLRGMPCACPESMFPRARRSFGFAEFIGRNAARPARCRRISGSGAHTESGIESAAADRDALPVLTRIVPAEVFSVRYGCFYR